MQQNCNYNLSGDRDELINYIIIKFTKLAQKANKTRNKRVRKVINLLEIVLEILVFLMASFHNTIN